MSDLDGPITLAACTLIALCTLDATDVEDTAIRAHLAVDDAITTIKERL